MPSRQVADTSPKKKWQIKCKHTLHTVKKKITANPQVACTVPNQSCYNGGLESWTLKSDLGSSQIQ